MDRRPASVGPIAAALLLLCAPLAAQTVDQVARRDSTTVAVCAGAATDGAGMGALAGGTVGWEVSPRATVLSTFSWLDRGTGADAFAGTFALNIALLPSRDASPFVEGGFGLYRAFYDVSRSRMPGFYRDRVDARAAAGGTATFTDPLMLVGAGVNVTVTPHFAIRPQVEAFVVTRGARRYIATAVTVRAVYYVDAHPIRLTGRN